MTLLTKWCITLLSPSSNIPGDSRLEEAIAEWRQEKYPRHKISYTECGFEPVHPQHNELKQHTCTHTRTPHTHTHTNARIWDKWTFIWKIPLDTKGGHFHIDFSIFMYICWYGYLCQVWVCNVVIKYHVLSPLCSSNDDLYAYEWCKDLLI